MFHLEMSKSKSKDSFKKLVKVKAKENSMKVLLNKKQEHSKMDKLEYKELQTQSYFNLKGIRSNEIREIFKFRLRMANFPENFRGQGGRIFCQLWHNHVDNQDSRKVNLDVDISDVYSDEVSSESINKLVDILENIENLTEAR